MSNDTNALFLLCGEKTKTRRVERELTFDSMCKHQILTAFSNTLRMHKHPKQGEAKLFAQNSQGKSKSRVINQPRLADEHRQRHLRSAFDLRHALQSFRIEKFDVIQFCVRLDFNQLFQIRFQVRRRNRF